MYKTSKTLPYEMIFALFEPLGKKTVRFAPVNPQGVHLIPLLPPLSLPIIN